MKVLAKTDENYISFHMGYVVALDVFSFFHAHSLDAISKTLNEKECVKFKLNRWKGIFPYEFLDSVDKRNKTQLSPKDAF